VKRSLARLALERGQSLLGQPHGAITKLQRLDPLATNARALLAAGQYIFSDGKPTAGSAYERRLSEDRETTLPRLLQVARPIALPVSPAGDPPRELVEPLALRAFLCAQAALHLFIGIDHGLALGQQLLSPHLDACRLF